MKRNLTLTCLFVWIGLLACNDHRIPTEPNNTCRVVQKTFKFPAGILPFAENLTYNGLPYRLGVNDTEKYEYDQQGRVSKTTVEFSISPQQANRSATYEYLPDRIKETRSFASSPNSSSITYMLTSRGYIANGNGSVYQYNTDGYLINSRTGNTTIIYTIANGNVVKTEETLLNPAGTTLNSTVYEYDLSKPGFPAGLSNPYFLLSSTNQPLAPYFGKSSQNLLTKKTTTTITTPTTGPIFTSTNTFHYIYSYDERGNIKRILTDISYVVNGESSLPNMLNVNDFEYECL